MYDGEDAHVAVRSAASKPRGMLRVLPIDVPDRIEPHRYVVRQPNTQLLDEREQLDEVEGIKAEVLYQPGVGFDGPLLQLQPVS